MNKASKSKWDSLIEDEIRTYIDSLQLEMQGGANQFRSPAMEKARITQEMKAALAFNVLTPHLQDAFTFLQEHGQEYLDKKAFEALLQSLDTITKESDQLNLEDLKTESFQKIFNISDESMDDIYRIALTKFEDEQYATALSLLVFLSTLSPSNGALWFRTGIAAQKKQDFDTALSAYKVAGELNPKLLETKLFSIECYLQKEQMAEAKEVFDALRMEIGKGGVSSVWKEEIIPGLEIIFHELEVSQK